jgi:hypothetical protein
MQHAAQAQAPHKKQQAGVFALAFVKGCMMDHVHDA